MEPFKTIDNPYTMQFGLVPETQYIKRQAITDEIILNFQRNVPTYRGLFITGVRGCGKTVLMGKVRDTIAQSEIKGKREWITVTLEPDGNLIDSLARALYRVPTLKAAFVDAEIDFSVLGVTAKIKNAKLIATDEKDALFFMMDVIKRLKLKVLVCIDEVTSTKDIAAFSHLMSSFANQDYDIFTLMTGLSRNIAAIKNKRDLTFLYRAKSYNLEVLNVTSIANDYEKTLRLSHDEAYELAILTRGYSFAYQVFGFYYWEEMCRIKNKENFDFDRVLKNVDETLFEMAYDKIWSEQSAKTKEILFAIEENLRYSGSSSVKVQNIIETIDTTSNTFTTYRSKLLADSILSSDEYGYLRFSLPRFAEYVRSRKLNR